MYLTWFNVGLITVQLLTLALLYLKLTCGYCKCSKHLVGKVVIVTGGNSGIGYETAKDLAERGARVILACRSEQRGTAARDKIIQLTGNLDVHFRKLDLASFSSVRAFADNILKNEIRLDILINNAGMFGSEYKETEDGLLLEMQCNHFSHFLLTCLLIPLLKASAPSRIVNVSSLAHRLAKFDLDKLNMSKETYDPTVAYANTKLCNILMSVELARQLKGSQVTANALHPGVVQTDLLKNVPVIKYLRLIIRQFFKSSQEGAQTSIYLAVAAEVEGISGCYYSDCHQTGTSSLGQDEMLARRLWDLSEKIVNLD